MKRFARKETANFNFVLLFFKYAGKDNFTGQQIYQSAECYINRGTAERLIRAKNRFRQDGYRVKIFDAYRPVSAQVRFWEVMPDERFVARPPDTSKPAEWKASHMNGLCVDLTLTDPEGREIEMPTPFDEMTERASLAWSGHSGAAKANGEYLKRVMEEAGFAADEEEWWHFYDVTAEPVPYTDFRF